MNRFSPASCIASVVLTLVSASSVHAAIKAVLVTNGFSRPLFVTSPPGDYDRLFVVEQRATVSSQTVGRIRIVKNNAITGTFLTVPGITTGNEQGLLGLAFHPNYAGNGKFYINYTTTGGGAAGHTVVAEYTVSSDPDVANPTGKVILQFDQPQTNHNGGWLAFGPNDGYLYIASGDGGGSGDGTDGSSGHTSGTGNAQDVTSNLLGKMLRIDVNGDDFPPANNLKDYAIPPANPFNGVNGDREIFAYGLRNPWRPSFDRLTGDFYIADVGQDLWEEVNYVPAPLVAGLNYGWRCREATHNFNTTNCTLTGLTAPIYEYGHNTNTGNAFSCGSPVVRPLGCSITGGYVYRGKAIPEMVGRYFFAEYCSNNIISFQVSGGAATGCIDHTSELAPGGGLSISSVVSFGESALGELFLCDQNGGELFKITRNPALSDADNDGVPDIVDNCLSLANPDQKDTDNDGQGDTCDADADGDGIANPADNCPLVANPGQQNTDGDDVGDACDSCPETPDWAFVDATGCIRNVMGDFDQDGDVDQSDFSFLQVCFTGLTGVVQSPCLPADLTSDTHVELADFNAFLNCMNGPDQAPPISCVP